MPLLSSKPTEVLSSEDEAMVELEKSTLDLPAILDHPCQGQRDNEHHHHQGDPGLCGKGLGVTVVESCLTADNEGAAIYMKRNEIVNNFSPLLLNQKGGGPDVRDVVHEVPDDPVPLVSLWIIPAPGSISRLEQVVCEVVGVRHVLEDVGDHAHPVVDLVEVPPADLMIFWISINCIPCIGLEGSPGTPTLVTLFKNVDCGIID